MPHQTTPSPAATPGTFEAATAAYDAAYEAVSAATPGGKPKRREVLTRTLRRLGVQPLPANAMRAEADPFLLPPEVAGPPQGPGSPTVYTAAQLHTRNRRRQFVTTDGRFMLRADGTSGFSYWHDTEKKDGKTVVGNPIKGPEGEFYTFFSLEHALATLNKICIHYAC